jgi:RNA polymerase sigma factor (sigma-70 family)
MSAAEINSDFFSAAYSHYHSEVESFLHKILRNPHESEDLAQEIFARLCSRTEEVTDVRAWLRGAVRNCLRMRFRGERRAPREFPLFDDEDDMAAVAAPVITEARIILDDSLDALDGEDQRALVDLIAAGDSSYREAAAHLGISPRRARYLYTLAMRQLKRDLSLKGIHEVADIM